MTRPLSTIPHQNRKVVPHQDRWSLGMRSTCAPLPEEHLSELLQSELGVEIPARHIARWAVADRIRVWQIVARVQMAGQAQCDVPWPMACLGPTGG